MEHLSSQKTSDQAFNNLQIQQYRDDEMDLKELFISLWEGKLIIVLMSLALCVVAIAYSLITEEKWETRAKLDQAELSQFALLQNQVSQFQPAFNHHNLDGTIVRSRKLEGFLSSKILLTTFVQQFNNRKNKKIYLDKNADFMLKFESLEISEDEEQNKIREQNLYHSWYKKLSIKKAVKAKNDSSQDVYDLTSEHDSAQKSYDLLIGYLDAIERKSRETIQDNLQSLVDGKKNELQQHINILKEQARSRLFVEKLRSKYELEIAKSAGVLRPLENYEADQNGVFNINLGSDALGAKVQVLNDLKNLSIFEPVITQYEAKLSLLNQLKINKNLGFQVMQYVEVPEKPYKLSAPNRVIISILGCIFGAGLGVFIVLIGVAFRKKEDEVVKL